jgi:nucleoside-diphosphate-sugar epimerase
MNRDTPVFSLDFVDIQDLSESHVLVSVHREPSGRRYFFIGFHVRGSAAETAKALAQMNRSAMNAAARFARYPDVGRSGRGSLTLLVMLLFPLRTTHRGAIRREQKY